MKKDRFQRCDGSCKNLPIKKVNFFEVFDRKTGKKFQMEVGDKTAELFRHYLSTNPEAKIIMDFPCSESK